jgi:Glycosyltransferase
MLTTGHWALDDRIFYKEAVSLRKAYEDVTIIGPYDKDKDVKDGVKIIGVERAGSLYQRYKLVDEVIRKAIDVKADVYHFHDLEIIFKILNIKKALPNAKIIYDVHEYYPEMVKMSKKIPAVLKPVGEYYVDKKEISVTKKLDYIITTDDFNKDRFSKINPNTDVVYNFSEFEVSDDVDIEKDHDVIYQGGISIERGALNLVKAIEIAKKEKPDVSLIFVGTFDDEEAKETVLNYVKDKGLSNNVNYIGKVSHVEVQKFIRKSRMGVVAFLPYPRYAKNIPIKQFEYMSCGIPVIGGYLPSVKRFITAYNSGLIVDPTSPQDIASAILKVLGDDNLRKELGRNGIKAVKESYNWANMEKKLIGIYEGLEK